MKNRVAIYLRESRDDNLENYETIETQRDLLQSFVERNALGTVNKIYIDDNVSGSTFERIGLAELQSDIEAKKIDMLVIKDLSRLGRNNAKTLLFLDYLEEHNIRVLTSDGRFDSNKDNEMVGIDTWFNERVLKDVSRKIRANLRVKIERGEYLGTAPFGYRKSEQNKNRLVIHDMEAATVKEIYQLYQRGYGYSKIAKQLNENFVKSPSFFVSKSMLQNWNPVAVMRVLSNRVYTGTTIQGVSQKLNYKSKKTIRLPKENWVITENTHESIISNEEFEIVQNLREMKRSKIIPERSLEHCFSGIIFCGNCGSNMFARKRLNRPMGYICSKYSRYGKSACSSHFVDEDSLKKEISNELLKLFNDSKNIEIINELIKKDTNKSKIIKSEIEKTSRQIELKLRQQEMLYLDRLEGRVSIQLFEKMNQQLDETIKRLQIYIRNNENSIQQIERQFDFFQIKDVIEKSCLDREIVRTFVEKVIVLEKEDDFKAMLDCPEINEMYDNRFKYTSEIVIIKLK